VVKWQTVLFRNDPKSIGCFREWWVAGRPQFAADLDTDDELTESDEEDEDTDEKALAVLGHDDGDLDWDTDDQSSKVRQHFRYRRGAGRHVPDRGITFFADEELHERVTGEERVDAEACLLSAQYSQLCKCKRHPRYHSERSRGAYACSAQYSALSEGVLQWQHGCRGRLLSPH
jgi:hypothetical protein